MAKRYEGEIRTGLRENREGAAPGAVDLEVL